MSVIFLMCILTIFAHSQYLMMSDDTCNRCWASVTPLVLYGVCQSIHACVMWPLVVFLAPQHCIGTAFGLMACFQNIGMSLFPPLMGYIHDHTKASHGYFWVEVAFLCLSVISFVLSYVVYSLD